MERTLAAEHHLPVMLPEILEYLTPALADEKAVLLDCTLGMGGHSEAILRACPKAQVIGIDRDPEALDLASQRLAEFGSRFTPVHAVYDELAEVCHRLGVQPTGILLDLGVSSLQLDADDRGFAYRVDAPLDMRMDQTDPLTAAEVLNTYAAPDLVGILRDFGEERYARRIVKSILRERELQPFDSSARLVELIRAAVPAAARYGASHPAKRTFQALRIEVNGELSALAGAIPQAISQLAVHGRIAVLSYHSLEDRIVKQEFAAGARSSAPADLPIELPQHAAYLKLLTRGAQGPTEREQLENPRSASARLRVATRIRTGGSA